MTMEDLKQQTALRLASDQQVRQDRKDVGWSRDQPKPFPYVPEDKEAPGIDADPAADSVAASAHGVHHHGLTVDELKQMTRARLAAPSLESGSSRDQQQQAKQPSRMHRRKKQQPQQSKSPQVGTGWTAPFRSVPFPRMSSPGRSSKLPNRVRVHTDDTAGAETWTSNPGPAGGFPGAGRARLESADSVSSEWNRSIDSSSVSVYLPSPPASSTGFYPQSRGAATSPLRARINSFESTASAPAYFHGTGPGGGAALSPFMFQRTRSHQGLHNIRRNAGGIVQHPHPMVHPNAVEQQHGGVGLFSIPAGMEVDMGAINRHHNDTNGPHSQQRSGWSLSLSDGLFFSAESSPSGLKEDSSRDGGGILGSGSRSSPLFGGGRSQLSSAAAAAVGLPSAPRGRLDTAQTVPSEYAEEDDDEGLDSVKGDGAWSGMVDNLANAVAESVLL